MGVSQQIKDSSGEAMGNRIKIKTVKNKCFAPYKTTELEIIYGQGFNKLGEIVDWGSQLDVIRKAGAWYSYEGEKLGQGRTNVIEHLKENPQLANEIEEDIRMSLGMVSDNDQQENGKQQKGTETETATDE